MAIHYEREDFGSISCGPNLTVQVKLVKFRDFRNNFKMFVDMRQFVKYVETGRVCATRKGIVVGTKFVMPLYSEIQKLPSDLPKDAWKVCAKFANKATGEIHLSTTNVAGSGFDIREFVTSSTNGYEGYSFRGVRFSYDLRENVCNMLLAVNERIKQIEAKKGLVSEDELGKLDSI